jgi:hypothetical protein
VKNNAQYWIVDALEVVIEFRGRDYKLVRTEPASLTQTRLRPGMRRVGSTCSRRAV